MSCYIVIPMEQEIEGVPETGYDPFYFPPEGGTLVFRFTNASFTRVLSALRNGAALTYDDQAFQVIWDFLVNVEYPVSVCDLVAECFASDATFRESVIASLMSDPAFVSSITGIVAQETIPTTYPPGVPNPSPTTNLAGTSNPTCDPDILWAQCLALVMDTHAAITDVLEKTEVSTNVVELIDALSDFPIVGWAKDAVGGSITIGLIQYYQEAVAEGYAAQYTTTAGGVQDQLACAIFCACQDDCEITVERMFEVYKTRLEAYVTVPSLYTMVDLLEFAAGINQDSTMVVDMAFFVAWGGAALGSFLYGKMFSKSFNLLMDLAVNDANDDWILLCEDCASPPPPDPDCVDFAITQEQFVPLSALAVWYSGVGWGPKNNSGTLQFILNRTQDAVNRLIIEVEFTFNAVPPPMQFTNSYGTIHTFTPTTASFVLNESNAPASFPYPTAGLGQIQIRPSAENGILTNGALRLLEFCSRT